MGVRDIAATFSRHLWATVSGACTTANVWSGLTTFGPDTVTTGGKLPKPLWANSISGLISTMVHDHSGAGGGISGLRLRGLPPDNQYLMSHVWGGQTTVSVGSVAPALLLSPSLKAVGDVGIDATPGVTASGVGTAIASIRWDAAEPTTKLQWRAAVADTTVATDLLSTPLVAYGGDTTFPLAVPGAGIRALGIAQTSDAAAAGQTIGQFSLQGAGIKDNPQNLGGMGIGSEGGATSGFSGVVPYWDDWIDTNPGSQINLKAGYTGADSGTESLGIAVAFQLP
jgi:hypothetical protein